MLKDDKNIEYFDQIYYELALLEFVEGNEDQGLNYLMQSSANAGNNNTQRTKTYLFLADYFFTNREYAKSQSYYDSAVSVIQKDYPDYEKISSKHAILSNLIEHITTVETQDSLLALADLPKEELDARIQEIVKEKERQERLAREEEEIRREMNRLNPNANDMGMDNTGTAGVWYFYNAAQVARGTNDFERLWGRRAYGDWWRYANRSVTEENQIEDPDDNQDDPLTYNSDEDEEQQEALEGVESGLLEYYKDIPFSATAKLIARKKVQESRMQIGKIYFDDLKEYEIAQGHFLTLLDQYPETPFKAEALFYLAKAYRQLGDTSTYDRYALQIADEYPNTPFNQVLNSKEVVETGESEGSDPVVHPNVQALY